MLTAIVSVVSFVAPKFTGAEPVPVELRVTLTLIDVVPLLMATVLAAAPVHGSDTVTVAFAALALYEDAVNFTEAGAVNAPKYISSK